MEPVGDLRGFELRRLEGLDGVDGLLHEERQVAEQRQVPDGVDVAVAGLRQGEDGRRAPLAPPTRARIPNNKINSIFILLFEYEDDDI